MDYDVIFIGSGHATWHAAVALKQAGKNVAIMEEDTVAGTCTNYGCDAKILLDGPFELSEQLKQYQGKGVNEPVKIDWSQLMAYKHDVIDPLSVQMTGLFKQMGIDLMMGHASLTDGHTVTVDDKSYTADAIVLGTGQRPAKLPIEGAEYLHDSREFLDLETMPKRITFIGAGIISLEFAAMAAALGSDVHVVEYGPRALAAFNTAHVDQLVTKLTAAGVTFHFGEGLQRVVPVGDHFQAITDSGLTIDTDYVLGATGRVPNVENLGLEDVGIAFNRRGIEVDDHLRTSVPSVYASGDVIDKPIARLTPTTTFESNYIAGQILGNPSPIDYPAIPAVVFTMPRPAQVGVSVAAAEADPNTYHIQDIPYGQRLAFQYKNELDADLKAVFDADNYLVGAEIIGNDAPDLINLLTLIINGHMSANDLGKQIFAFPSSSVGIIDLLQMSLHRD